MDWVNNWKQYFHQFYVDDILIIPSWEEVKPEDSDKLGDPHRSGHCIWDRHA
ncbi:MAG: 50S ribosomal protein L11 methyltransferase [[Clostridium] scindens]